MAERFWKCARCGELQGEKVIANRIVISREHLFLVPNIRIASPTGIDVCDGCIKIIRDFLSTKPG